MGRRKRGKLVELTQSAPTEQDTVAKNGETRDDTESGRQRRSIDEIGARFTRRY